MATSEEKRLGKKYGNCYAVSQELFQDDTNNILHKRMAEVKDTS
jgi:hypothetical protein